MQTQVLSRPPQSLPELSRALSLVTEKKGFFGRDLFVLAQPFDGSKIDQEEPSSLREEIAISDIVNKFLDLSSNCSKTQNSREEIVSFYNAVSAYKRAKKQEGCSRSLTALITCVEYCVKKYAQEGFSNKHFGLCLITGCDQHESAIVAPGAMTRRALRYLVHGIPVIMPYEQLCDIVNTSFFDPNSFRGQSEFIIKSKTIEYAHQVCAALADSKQWGIFLSPSTTLIVLLPLEYVSLLQLKNYQSLTFDQVKEEAILRTVGKTYAVKPLETKEISEVLDSDVRKHVIWVGHGNLPSHFGAASAMGLPLQQVADIINEVRHVAFWDLHTCYLAGNIHKIMANVRQRNAAILVTGGAVCASSPPNANDCIRAYLALSSQALDGPPEKFIKKMGKIYSLINSFVFENHPHIILPGTREIVPLTYPKVVDRVSTLDTQKTERLERLYIDQPITTIPLRLSEHVHLLRGLDELHVPFLFSEIHTPLAIQDFFDTSLKVPEKEGAFGFFMVQNLICADKVYKKVLYFLDNDKSTYIMYASKRKIWGLKQCDTSQKGAFRPWTRRAVNKILQAALKQVSAFESYSKWGMTAEIFYAAIRKEYFLPGAISKTALQLRSEPEEQKFREASGEWTAHSACSWFDAKFFQAISRQDTKAIVTLRNEFPDKLGEAMRFCVRRDLFDSFSMLFKKLNKKKHPTPEALRTKHAVIVDCIKMRRVHMLELVDSYPDAFRALRDAAQYGNPAIFSLVHKACNKDPLPITLTELIAYAKDGENWEMVQYLENHKL